MKNYALKNSSDVYLKTTPNQPSQTQGKMKYLDLKIATNNNENLSPNNTTSKYCETNSNLGNNNFSNASNNSNIPSTTKNINLKIDPKYLVNRLTLNGSASNRNSENVMEKKLFKIISVSELNKKKNEPSARIYKTLKTETDDTRERGGVKEKKANLDRVKISHKSFGVIEAYSAITTEGLYRDYNEDRVSIIFNVSKPSSFIETETNPWPKCSFFGLYDGHGGTGCADYLRDNLHKLIIGDSNFPKNPQKAILNGFVKIEKSFTQKSVLIEKNETGEKINILDRSGSCAIVVLIIEKRCFIANVGDSRAIMSGNFGEKVYALSRDHRPNDEKEYQRVLEGGGKIYQTEATLSDFYGHGGHGSAKKNTGNSNMPNIMGPLRVVPGKLSVSRTIGDIEAKEPRCGGNPNVVIAVPEIKYFDFNSTNDFIVIGCDGIFEKLKNKEIIENFWKVIYSEESTGNRVPDIHNLNGILAESLVDLCFEKKSTDNLTAVVIGLRKNLRDKDSHVANNYISQTQQVNKIPKVIKTEVAGYNNNYGNSNSNAPTSISHKNEILSKIIKSTQIKQTSLNSERFMSLNK